MVSLKSAGNCSIPASQAGNATYEPATPVTRTFTIATAALTVTAQDRTITYGQATPTLELEYVGFVGTDTAASLGGSLVYTFAGISPAVYGPSTTPPTSVGYYTITPSGLTSDNYAISYAAGTYGINPVVVTTALAWAGDPSPNPVRAGQAITFSGALTDAGSGTAIGQTSLQVNLREATGSSCELPGSTRRDFGTLDADGHVTLSWTPGVADIGTHHLLLAFYQTTVGTTNYADATSTCVSVAVTAAKLDQTISFTAPTGVTYGDADLALGATADSSLAVSYASSTPLVCTIASGQLHVVAAGTCTITASQAGNDDYAAATPRQPDLHDRTGVAGDAHDHRAGVGDVRPRRLRHHDERRLGHGRGDVRGRHLARLLDRRQQAPRRLGQRHLRDHRHQGGRRQLPEHDLGVVPGHDQQGVPGHLDHRAGVGHVRPRRLRHHRRGRREHGSAHLRRRQLDGLLDRHGQAPRRSGSGTCVITASKAGDTNYTADTSDPFTVAVHKAAQSIDFGSLADKDYGDPAFTVSATASSTLQVSFGASGKCSIDGTTVEITGAGTCTITASQAGNDDYAAATPVSRTFTIAPAPQATLTITGPASATYGHADYAITTSGGSGTGAVTFEDGTSPGCSIVDNKLHVDSGSGTCAITATKAADANYLSTTSVSYTVTISKGSQDISITAPASVTYGHADYDITVEGAVSTGALTFDAGSSTACSIDTGKLHVALGQRHLRDHGQQGR